MKTSKKKPQNAVYRISDIKEIGYYQNSLESLGLKHQDIIEGSISINPSIRIDDEIKSVTLILKIDFLLDKNEESLKLFGIETSHKFEIQNFNQVVRTTKNKKELPQDVLLTFLHTAVSSTRGMLAILNNSDYSRIFLPIIDIPELMQAVE